MKLVLDTNVVLDWLHFSDSSCAALGHAVSEGWVQLVTAESCLQELTRVLERPEFGLDTPAKLRLMDSYLAQVTIFPVVASTAHQRLPRCKDADDQKFLELAWSCQANCLVSRDKAILALGRRLQVSGAGYTVLTPAQFAQWFNRPASDAFVPPPELSD